MAANNSNVSNDEPSRLLALPVELVHRITDKLSDETLTTFRLTCKAIEAATFDQFAKVFLEERYCFIYEKPRWTLLNNIVTSRMADRVPRWQQLQVVPGQDRYGFSGPASPNATQLDIEECLLEAVGPQTQVHAWPSGGVVERCLFNIRYFAPDLHIELDLDLQETDLPNEPEEARTTVIASILAALAASRMKLTTFSVAQRGLGDIGVMMGTMGCELSSPMRSLQTFSYTERASCGNNHDRSCISGLLESAVKLRDLTLLLDEDDNLEHGWLNPMIPGIFRANNFAHLETLYISDMVVDGVDLIAALSQCRWSLRKPSIGTVSITEGDDEWFRILGIFAEMPLLSSLSLSGLGVVGEHHLVFENLKHGLATRNSSGIMEYEGLLEVAAGLKELLDARVTGSYWQNGIDDD